MLQSASRSIQCPLGSFKLSSKCYAQQPSQCGKGTGTLGDSQRTGLPGRVPFSARTQPYAGHSQWLHFNPLALQSLGIKTLQDFLAQRTRDECIRANGDHEGRAQYGRELWNEKLGPVAECEYPRDQDHIGTVPFEKIPSIFVAVAAVSILVLCPAPAHALFHTDPTILYASPLTRSQRYAQLHKYKDSAPEPGKPSNEGQREHLPTNIDARSLEQKSQAQPGAAFRASVETCSNAVGQYVEEKFSAARIVVRKGLSKLDLTGVLVGSEPSWFPDFPFFLF